MSEDPLSYYALTRDVEFHCHVPSCGRNITHEVRIVCQDSKADLCTECFAKGEEFANHKSNSPYIVVDNLSSPLFKGGWEVAEELALLEGIDLYGFGNWKAVSIHIGSRTAEECSQHYSEIYFSSDKTKPLPNDDMLCGYGSTKERDNEEDEEGTDQKGEDGNGKGEKCGPSSSSSSFSSSSTTPVDTEEDGDSAAAAAAAVAAAAAAASVDKTEYVSGYMPLRGDFDVEHDNDAELILADMEFSPDDHESEKELKLKIIEIYNSKLDERERRKKFVLERGLLDYKKHQAIERRRPKEERELYNRLKCFARFHTPEEHEEFVQGLIKEMRLRQRIEKLQVRFNFDSVKNTNTVIFHKTNSNYHHHH
jgi:transcriptional adapter 2-alpha